MNKVPYRFENLLSGIQRPGQWYVDAKRGTVWLWPLEAMDPNGVCVTASFLPSAIEVRGTPTFPVRFLTLSGFSVQGAGLVAEASRKETGSMGARGAAVSLSEVEDCLIEKLTLRCNAGSGVAASGHVKRVTISQCLIYEMGGAGVTLSGSLMDPDASCADNRIIENHVHHCGMLYWHSSGIGVACSEGGLIGRNLVHDMPYAGITVGGGARHRWFAGWPRKFPELEDLWARRGEGEPTITKVKALISGHNRIEGNIVYNVMSKLDDGAAIYCHAGHHSLMKNNFVWRGGRPKTFGLYFDDEEMSSTMVGNIVLDCPVKDESYGSAIHIHNNPNNTLVNNLVLADTIIFSYPNSYGGHVIQNNVFLYRGTARVHVDPSPVLGAGDGRRQVGWSYSPSVMEENLFWSTLGEKGVASHVKALREKGFDALGKTIVGMPGLEITPKRMIRVKRGTNTAKISFSAIDFSGMGPQKRFVSAIPQALWEALAKALALFDKRVSLRIKKPLSLSQT